MTDIWGMSRSVELWIKPEEFSPERFLNEEADVLMRGTEVRGDITHYKFMAFGAGKRACAGYNVGKLMLSLMVSRLVWHFEWKLHNVDLSPDLSGTVINPKHPENLYPSRTIRECK
eukprot:TRINITY_DN10413_c0_g1_i2.p3 TRINITY_DN10413_c0_g1~~TRINITY_DN10413_c0_g1_i2.p3  ORF type:complete len:116 (+),score=19.22 TRINITY_DN10413_c0_g1_i2:589-936(+)